MWTITKDSDLISTTLWLYFSFTIKVNVWLALLYRKILTLFELYLPLAKSLFSK